jgi:VCBS repeat-containing protein
MNCKIVRVIVAMGLLIVAGSVGSAYAASYSFNYNTISATASNSSIQSYMNTKLGGAGTVALSGAKGDNNYTGDGHVVNGTTLGTDETGTDRFIITLQSGSTDTIKMQFSGLQLYSVTFDYEIFPDATCTSPTNCPAKPDFSFYAGSGGSTSLIFHDYGDFPAWGSDSAVSTNERSAQKIVHSYTYTSDTAFDTIWFQDWPATIGVDNVTITTRTPPTVPEPASILLLGSGLMAVVRRRKLTK